MSSAARVALVFLASFVFVPASAGTNTTRPPVALTASPAHVALMGSAQATVRVTNSGRVTVVVDAVRVGFSLDLRGRPKIVPGGGARAADKWLTIRPRRLALGPGESTLLTVSSRLPARAEPGDHDALVLLTTRPVRRAGVAVRMRIGVVVVVRAPGIVVRRLELRALHVRRAGRVRMLELLVANRGNVTEALEPRRLRLSLRRGGNVLARLRAETRELRPRTRGIVQFHYRGRVRGWVKAAVVVSAQPGRPMVQRTFRVRL